MVRVIWIIVIILYFCMNLGAQSSNPRTAQYLFFQGLNEQKNRNWAAAEEIYKTFLRKYPQNSFTPQVLYNLSDVLIQKGDTEGAIFYLKSLVEDYPSDYRFVLGLRKLVDILKNLGTMEENLAYLDKLLDKKTPYFRDVIRIKLQLLVYYNKYEEAYRLLAEKIKEYPDFFTPAEKILDIVSRVGKIEEFLAIVKKLYEDKRFSFPTYCKVLSYFGKKGIEKKLLQQRAVKGDPYYQYALDRLAEIYEEDGKISEAISLREKLFREFPHLINNMEALLDLYLKDKKLAAAQKLIFTFLNRRRYFSLDFLDKISQLYEKNGVLESLLEVFDKMEHLYRESSYLNYLENKRNWVYFKLKRYDEVLNNYFKRDKLPSFDKASEYLYQLSLSSEDFRDYLKKWLEENFSSLDFSHQKDILRIYILFLQKNGDIKSILSFFLQYPSYVDEEFVIKNCFNSFFNDVKIGWREKLEIIKFIREKFSDYPKLYVLASYFYFKYLKTVFKFKEAGEVASAIDNYASNRVEVMVFFDTRMWFDFYFSVAEIYFYHLKDFTKAFHFLSKGEDYAFTHQQKKRVLSILYQLYWLSGKLEEANKILEEAPFQEFRLYFSGWMGFLHGKMTVAAENFKKYINTNMDSDLTNDSLFYLYLKDKYLASFSKTDLGEFLRRYIDFLSGKDVDFSDLKSNLWAEYLQAQFTAEKGKYHQAEELLKQIVLKREKNRYLAEKAQELINQWGVSGKLKMGKEELAIEIRTFLSYFMDSPYVEKWRWYLSYLLEE